MPGAQFNIPFLETYFSAVAGGIVSSSFFFFGSEFVIHFSRNRRLKKEAAMIEKGLVPPIKKKFTRTNKMIIKIKHLFGIWGICVFSPLLLSIPIGTIVAAKFYGEDKNAFPIIVAGMFFNAALTSLIWYAVL